MPGRPELTELVARHRQLECQLESQRSLFLSDWNCDNPFTERFLGPRLSSLISEARSPESYIYFDEEVSILDAIRRFHLVSEGLHLSRSNVLAGPGSSSFLAAFSIWLRRSGYTEIHYLPPIYHTLHYILESVGISATRLTDKQAFEAGYSLDLPSRRTVLLMCDPIWYAGKPVPKEQIAKIAEWQRSTRSLVFVDGSFQYLAWDDASREATATLDPELTFRLICPAKALAVPVFRFAYLLHPSHMHEELVFVYESMTGGASATDLVFAHRALDILNGPTRNRPLTNYFQSIYATLVDQRLIRTAIVPESGYFAFAVPLSNPAGLVVMDARYFELEGHSDYCRINLMAARRIFGLPALEVESVAPSGSGAH